MFQEDSSISIHALQHPAFTKILGPIIPMTIVPNGVPIPGANIFLDQIRAAFNIGTMSSWLDYNGMWLAAELGHHEKKKDEYKEEFRD